MRCTTGCGIEQGGGIPTMHTADRIIGVLARNPGKHRSPGRHFDEIEIQSSQNSRLSAGGQQRLQLRESIEIRGYFLYPIHCIHLGYLAATKCESGIGTTESEAVG